MDEFRAAVIRVDHRLWTLLFSDLFDIDYTTTQGELRRSGALEEVHRRLQLPMDFGIIGIYVADMGRTWNIGVYGTQFPAVPEGIELPVLAPIYQKDTETGEVRLLRIEGYDI